MRFYMNTASTICLTSLVIVSLIQQCRAVAADPIIPQDVQTQTLTERALFTSNKEASIEHSVAISADKLSIAGNKMAKPALALSSLDLTQEWGRSALRIVSSSATQFNDEQEIAQLFLVDDIKLLQKNINLQFKTGLYSLKNNYVLSASYRPLLLHRSLVPTSVQNDLYQSGRLSTETGYNALAHMHKQDYRVFIRGNYSVLHAGRFDLSLTASFEAMQTSYDNIRIVNPLSITANEQATSATFGVVGSFDLSNRWSLIGALTSSRFDSENINYGLAPESKLNMALIGTTYSF